MSVFPKPCEEHHESRDHSYCFSNYNDWPIVGAYDLFDSFFVSIKDEIFSVAFKFLLEKKEMLWAKIEANVSRGKI